MRHLIGIVITTTLDTEGGDKVETDSSLDYFYQFVRETVTKAEALNLLRTRYLLKNYAKYHVNCPKTVDLQTSEAVMNILAFSFTPKHQYNSEDEHLMDNCGFLLSPAVGAALKQIKELPIVVSERIYPVLYRQYFDPDGPAIDSQQLLKRLKLEGTNQISSEEITKHLSEGERMMSSLLFQQNQLTLLKAIL